MATGPATFKKCINCGYDRTGLTAIAGLAAPCPECGRHDPEVEWPGWGGTLWIGAIGPVVAHGFGVLPPLAMAPALTNDGSTFAMYLLLPWFSIGACATALLLLFMPVIAAASSCFHWLPRLGRPGYLLAWAASMLVAIICIAGLSWGVWLLLRVQTR